MIFQDLYEVKTSNGFQNFAGIKKVEKQQSVTFKFLDETEITVTENHKFYEGNSFQYTKSFKIGDVLSGKVIKDIIINSHEPKSFYDLIEVDNGHHYTTSGIESSNCAFIRNNIWSEFIDSIMPSQSGLAWKKNIFISTMKGMNHWYDITQGAEKGTNGFTLYDLDWRRVPRFDAKNNQMTPEEFREKIVKRFGILYFNQNYANEAIGSSYTLIKSEILKEMNSKEPEEIRDGKLKIYSYPEKGHKYIFTVDAAKDGSDNFAIQVTDITDINFKQAASAKLQIDYLLMPEFIYEWATWYNNAYLIIENNEGAGQSIADQIYKDYEYENLHFDKDGKKKKKYPGFRTTTKSRKLILQTMKLFIENGKLQVNDRSTISEFFQFVLVNNKFQADEGCHDDMIMSLALTFVPFCNTENFEDMKVLVKDLYSVEESDDSGFSEYLTIGNFDDGTEIQENNITTYYNGVPVFESSDGFY